VKAKVYVTLKDGIHDPQGKAILQALLGLGFEGINGVRVGKYFELDLPEQSVAEAEQFLKGSCEKLLANTVIEKYRFEVS